MGSCRTDKRLKGPKAHANIINQQTSDGIWTHYRPLKCLSTENMPVYQYGSTRQSQHLLNTLRSEQNCWHLERIVHLFGSTVTDFTDTYMNRQALLCMQMCNKFEKKYAQFQSVYSSWYSSMWCTCIFHRIIELQWRYNGRNRISNYRRLDCLLNRLFWSKKASKLCVTGLCEGNPPVTGGFPSQRASNAKNVFIWLRHVNSLRRIITDPVYSIQWLFRVQLLLLQSETSHFLSEYNTRNQWYVSYFGKSMAFFSRYAIQQSYV